MDLPMVMAAVMEPVVVCECRVMAVIVMPCGVSVGGRWSGVSEMRGGGVK